jgi:DNA-binding transcriptional MerR regulator
MSGRHAPSRHNSHGDEPSYSLDELTTAAGVTVRTVRYYIAEGLLPPPVGGGPRTRYTQRHLDRLILIGRLKDAYMPLKEIRRRLQSLSDEEIGNAASISDTREMTPPDSAAAYIGQVLHESHAPVYEAASMPAPHMHAPPDQTWRRIPITDEAELLITEDAHDRRGGQIDAAIDWLRRILNES